jgi:hypothetical protein
MSVQKKARKPAVTVSADTTVMALSVLPDIMYIRPRLT